MTADAVLIGYYGRGNFGDDILFRVADALTRQARPDASVAVRTAQDAPYLNRLANGPLAQIPFGTRGRHDLIIHGGGGTFFDFSLHSPRQRFISGVALGAGNAAYVHFENLARRVAGRPRMTARKRIGLGLGVGTFTPGSPKLLEALPVLADFNALWLRDPGSEDNLAQLGVSPPVTLGSDLAFLHEYWHTKKRRAIGLPAKPKLGLVLRDWPQQGGSLLPGAVSGVFACLEREFDFTLISLDPATDVRVLSAFTAGPVLRWLPEREGLDDFLAGIAMQTCLLTARAHGAICGACLGLPSVIIDIEPKLRAVHRMLPNATRLWRPDEGARLLRERITEVLAVDADTISADVSTQRALSERAWRDVCGRLADGGT